MKFTVSEILSVNDHEFLVDERDSKGLADDSTAVQKKIYKIDLAGAQDASRISGAANLAAKAVPKILFLDIVTALSSKGMAGYDVPAKLEGLTFGTDVVIDGGTKHTLYVSNDHDGFDDHDDGSRLVGASGLNGSAGRRTLRQIP